MHAQDTQDTLLQALRELDPETLVQDAKRVKRLLRDAHPAAIADALEALPPERRLPLWRRVPGQAKGDVLLEVHDEVRAELIRAADPDELVIAAQYLDMDELADIYGELPRAVVNAVVRAMDRQRKARLDAVLAYPEDTAGGLMNPDAISVRADATLRTVIRYLRRLHRSQGGLPEQTDTLMVVNREARYVGILHLADVVAQDPELTVAEVYDSSVEAIAADIPAARVARLFEDRDLTSAGVVDADGHLLGRITVDDVVDVIRDEADHNLMSPAGVSEEEDMFGPVWRRAWHRNLWLGINLLTAFVAAAVIALFQDTIDHIVALAVLMPIVASMGGIAGTQTLTLVIRGIALEQVSTANARWLLSKEMLVGIINGLVWAVVVAFAAALWFDSPPIGAIIAAAMLTTLLFAALSGALIPLLLDKLGIDPALAGGVVLTTVTDVVGFLSFLGLATWYLL
jgi:magnesium transporter